jgi:hypothetical protein
MGILRALQAAITARDRDAVVAYLTAVVEGDSFHREYGCVVPFHDGFAASGELVADGPDGEFRAPFRLTLAAVDGRIRSVHGSIPYGFCASK